MIYLWWCICIWANHCFLNIRCIQVILTLVKYIQVMWWDTNHLGRNECDMWRHSTYIYTGRYHGVVSMNTAELFSWLKKKDVSQILYECFLSIHSIHKHLVFCWTYKYAYIDLIQDNREKRRNEYRCQPWWISHVGHCCPKSRSMHCSVFSCGIIQCLST